MQKLYNKYKFMYGTVYLFPPLDKGAMKHQKRGNIVTLENNCHLWLQKLMEGLVVTYKLLGRLSIFENLV